LTAGHGTFESRDNDDDDENPVGGGSKIYASVAGVVHYINKYVCVKPLRQAYKPDMGDVVVGRIVAVMGKSWNVDIGAYQHAVLNLTNINLPGGEQRRRNEDDQLNMRSFFKEGDIISAEVQNIGSQDGKITLQTRNLKYGKLFNGFLASVDSNYVRRSKVHIHDMSEPLGCAGLKMILGVNGYIWISQEPPQETSKKVAPVSAESRDKMATLRNCVVALEKSHIPIYKETILKTVESCKGL
jgi:exosome complex component RRP4